MLTVDEIIKVLQNYSAEEIVELCEVDSIELCDCMIDIISEKQEMLSEQLEEEWYASDD